MKSYRVCGLLLCACLAMGGLAGCRDERPDEDAGQNSAAGASGMEATPVVDYTAPRLFPNILTDLGGYSAEDVKEAAVKGSRLPEEFRLRDASTGEVVFAAELKEVEYSEELKLYMGLADFSEVAAEGTYYLECDIVGRSYPFDIKESLYVQLFDEVCLGLYERCGDRELELTEAVALLEAYEWYGRLFPDEDADGTPEVLEALKGWVAHMEEKGAEAGQEALYAAFLAKFSYNYQKFDLTYATDCLKRSSTVFGQVQTAQGRDADSFFALTELYRATNLAAYGNQIQEYAGFFENNSSYLDERSYLFGSMTYLMTRHKVNVPLCTGFMETLMDRGEEIAKRSEEVLHPVTGKNNGPEELLKQALELSCANYVLNNYQYTNTIEEFLHYLMGKNLESVNFYETDGEKIEYLLLLAQLAANHSEAVPKE